MFFRMTSSIRTDTSQVDYIKILFLSSADESFTLNFYLNIGQIGMLRLWNVVK